MLRLFVLILTLATVVSRAEKTNDIFAPNAPVLRLSIEISRENFRSLQQQARKPVPCIVREGNTVYSNVMAHVKGAAGSFRDIGSDKPSLTLSFGKLDQDQRFHGLHKIHVNNSVQDQSFTTYKLCSDLFNDAGIPAARVTQARVTLNGRDMGFYVVVEGFTKDFLKRHFDDPRGNLYDGGFLQEITDNLERDSGEGPDDKKDLKALVKACTNPDRNQRWAELQKILDTDRFIDFMVLEDFTWDWDGYMAKHNNYRVYHNPVTDKMVFLPHGMDQMFWDPHGSIWRPEVGGLVARAIMETPEGAKAYRDHLHTIFDKVFHLETLTNRIDQLTARNRSAAAEVGHGFLPNWENNVRDLRSRVVERWTFIKTELENEPKPMDFSKPIIVKGWRQQMEMGNSRIDRAEVQGKPTLHIAANGNSGASWRSTVTLDPGKYRFSALAQTAKLVAMRDQKGEGAGIRISGTQEPRRNHLAGDVAWTPIQYEFDVVGVQSQVILVCELRAQRGEVWFDASSLKLEKLK